jgi:hypothetical protein
MNTLATQSRRARRTLTRWLHGIALTLPLLLAATLSLGPLSSRAAPGAHGPDGEHLDAPGASRGSSSLPRMEAKSEAFELVAELRGAQLIVFVDRYDSNEPVLGAKLDVESGAAKATAAFRAEQGDYVVTDAAFLKLLSTPGEHGLVFTLAAGKDSDLLDGTLAIRTATTGAAGDHGHDHGAHGHDHTLERAALIGAFVAAIGLVVGFVWWRRRRRSAAALQGAQP